MQKFVQFITIIAVYVAAMMLSVPAHAADSKDSGDSDKVDLKKLEEKYWAAKDSDYSVIQNRAYPKDHRFFASISYGSLMNDQYSYGKMTDIGVGYYFSEKWGLAVEYEYGDLRDNDGTVAFRNQFSTSYDYNQFVNSYALKGIFVPFYAKMSFVDKAIVYFDMQIAAGVGQATYEIKQDVGNTTGTAPCFNFDVSQQFFFNKLFAIRFDIKNRWYTEQHNRFHPTSGQARDLGSVNQQDTIIQLGTTFFFP